MKIIQGEAKSEAGFGEEPLPQGISGCQKKIENRKWDENETLGSGAKTLTSEHLRLPKIKIVRMKNVMRMSLLALGHNPCIRATQLNLHFHIILQHKIF